MAALLGTTPASISRWRNDSPIPDTVANLLNFHVANNLSEVEIPLSLTELFALSDLATRRGQSVKELLLSLIKKAIAPTKDPADGINDNILYLSADTDLAKIAEDDPEYKTPAPKPSAP